MPSGSGSGSKCALCGQPAGPDHACTNPLARYLGAPVDDRYVVDTVLGKGGMGVVFGATQTSVHRRVAMKMLHPSLATTPEFFERFRREAELASRLHHPNIITVFDFGRTKDGGCYYVMELVEGISLRALVRAQGPLPVSRAVKIVEQIGRALACAHAAGVIHRDLKPHNVMCSDVDGADFCKVLDFGLVKAMEDDGAEGEQLTTTGQVLGTPSYMAPEQASGEPLDQRADLFALAACLYFCLTGAPPCKTNSAHKALAMLMNGEIPPISSRRVGAPVPPALEAFVKRVLSFSPDDRPQTAEQFIAEMRKSLEGAPAAALDARPEGLAESAEGTGSSRYSRGGKGSPARSASRSKPGARKADGPKVGLYVGAVVGAIAVGVLAFGARTLLAPAPAMPAAPVPPKVQEPARAQMVAVHIETSPAGAQVFRGSELLGVTPADLLLKREAVNFILKREGYQTLTRGFDLAEAAAGAPVQVKLELVALPPEKPADARPAPPRPTAAKKPAGPDIPTFDD